MFSISLGFLEMASLSMSVAPRPTDMQVGVCTPALQDAISSGRVESQYKVDATAHFMKSSPLSNISFAVLIAFLSALILLIVPITDNFLMISKNYILFFGALFALVLFVLNSMRKQAFEVTLTPYTIPLLLFGLAIAASTFFTNAYPVEGLLGMGGVHLSFVLIALFGSSVLAAKKVPSLLVGFGSIVTALVFFSALELTGFGPATLINQVFNLNLPSSLLFNLSGSSLVGLQLVLIALVGMIAHFVLTKTLAKPFAIMMPILLIGLALFGWSLLPGRPASPILPSFAASWSVMLDTMHNPRAALIGVGPGSYGNAYLQHKPLWMNGTEAWAAPFVQGANMPLTLLTSMGFLGFLAWSFLAFRIISRVRLSSPDAAPLAWMLGLSIIFQLILPPNAVLIGVQAILLAGFISLEKGRHSVLRIRALDAEVLHKAGVENPRSSLPSSAIIAGSLALILVGGLFYLTGRAYAAHYFMGQAERAAGENNAELVYNHQMTAVNLNPYMDYFRRNWASTNIIIAAALSNKTDATEAEAEQSSQLVQQAIREARSAVLLDPNDTQNSIVLAQIYSNLIGSVEEADQWAVQEYLRAISLNPSDPELIIALGGLFTAQENHQQAATLYQQAVQVKGDHPNALYNLASALKQLEQPIQAREVLQALLTVLPQETDDYVTVMQEIEELDEVIAALPPAETSQLDGQAGQANQVIQTGSDGQAAPTQQTGQQAPSLIEQDLQQPSSINTPSNTPLSLQDDLSPAAPQDSAEPVTNP